MFQWNIPRIGLVSTYVIGENGLNPSSQCENNFGAATKREQPRCLGTKRHGKTMAVSEPRAMKQM